MEAEAGRDALTVPAVAARAGVTPSTIYRRWGDLAQLLSDVAVENLHPDGPPPDCGSYRSDLEAWLTQYLEEMSSDPGRRMLRDVAGCSDPLNAGECARRLSCQFAVMAERARARGERALPHAVLLDFVIAPLIYRILFSAEVPDTAVALALLDRALRDPDTLVVPMADPTCLVPVRDE